MKKSGFISRRESKPQRSEGFTLIELLVTISIIAVLSTIGASLYQGIQTKAKDSIRKNDLAKIATALEIYREQYGKYVGTTQGSNCITGDIYSDTDFLVLLNGSVPKDPAGQNYLYTTENNCQSFRLFTKLENCTSGSLCTYTNYNYSVTSDDLSLAPHPG